MTNPFTESDPLTFTFCLKRGTLMGAGLGLLVGLLWLSFAGTSLAETSAIVIWRNWILAGAGVGVILGGVVGWRLCGLPFGDPPGEDNGS